jgi:hypothetical protein
MNSRLELDHVREEPGAWPSSELSVWAGCVTSAGRGVAGFWVSLLIILSLLDKDLKTISRHLFEVEFCFYKFKIKTNK